MAPNCSCVGPSAPPMRTDPANPCIGAGGGGTSCPPFNNNGQCSPAAALQQQLSGTPAIGDACYPNDYGNRCIAGSAGPLPQPGPCVNYPAASFPPGGPSCTPSTTTTTTTTGGCLAAETRVPLWNGECKLAIDIAEGDVLTSITPEGEKRPQTVKRAFHAIQPRYKIVHRRGQFICSSSHKVMASGFEQIEVPNLNVEKHGLLDPSGNAIEILAVFQVDDGPVFGWNCLPDFTFLAEGVLHHNDKTLGGAAMPSTGSQSATNA